MGKLSILKKYVPVIILILMVFAVTGYFLLLSIKNHFISQMLEESKYLFHEYNLLSSIAIESNKVSSELIEDRIMVAANIILKEKEYLTQDLILKLSQELKVDHISWFDENGEIHFSTVESYIGWKVYKDHPIEKFMTSSKKFLLEDIRKETISGNSYKFGYKKDTTGCFVQVGISAENINKLSEKLNKQSIINSLSKNNPRISMFVIDSSNKLTASNNLFDPNISVLDSEELNFVNKGMIYQKFKYFNDKKIYRILMPIVLNEKHKETLGICYTLDNTNTLVMQLYLSGTILLVFLFLIISGIILYITRNNNKIEYLAYYDPITNLPNKDFFLKMISETSNCKTLGGSIILLKIEQFKAINQIYGHNQGDFVLKTAANYIVEYSLKDDNLKVFKYFSDKFLLYLCNITEEKEIQIISEKILTLFELPILIDDEFKKINIHMSAITYNETDIKEVLKMADIALEWPNNSNLTFYNDCMQNQLLRKDSIKKEIFELLQHENKQHLYLVFQPQQDLNTDKIVGFEALIRFESQNFGYVSPEELINIAESENLIIELGKWILKDACRFIKKIENLNISNFRVAVNISPRQLISDSFVSDVIKIVSAEKIDINHLELEITESMIINDFELANKKLLFLKTHGIEIALDDFGTGYSSLSRLDGLYIDKLKIDKYFINKIKENDSDNLMAEAIIILAKKLNLTIVAEGVEHYYQKEYLKRKNCDILQGYFFSRPISAEKCLEMLNN